MMNNNKELLRDQVLEKSIVDQIFITKDEMEDLMIYDKCRVKEDVTWLIENDVDPYFISLAIKKYSGWSFSDVKLLYIRHMYDDQEDRSLRKIRILKNNNETLDFNIIYDEKYIYCSEHMSYKYVLKESDKIYY